MLGYDYSKNGLYFVTICVKDRLRCLGFIGQVGASRDLPVQDGAIDRAAIDGAAIDGAAIDGASRDLHVHQSPVRLILNDYGFIVESQIKWLASQYPYIEIHNYVVMPDHVHLI
ncbi:MAG: hypothetical protein K0A92_10035, partial [Methyloprofundus sp.]|nr:hypothetical protein [Methyloprofundus sp.]